MVMIPWVREKFIERRAKWFASRGKKGKKPPSIIPSSNSNTNMNHNSNSTTISHCIGEEGGRLTAEVGNSSQRQLLLDLEQEQQQQQQQQQQREQQEPQQGQYQEPQQQHIFITSVFEDREIVVRVETLSGHTTIVNACPIPLVAESNGHHLPHHQPHGLHSGGGHGAYQAEPSSSPVRRLPLSQIDRCQGYDNNASLITDSRILSRSTAMDDIRSRRSTASGSTRSSGVSSHLGNQQTSSTNVLGEPKLQSATGSTNNAKERIKVRIISPSTRILSFQTENSKKLLELKNEVILELSDDMASMPIFAPDSRVLGPRFRLIKADYEGSEMNEQQTLAQLNIHHNDILVLVFKRNGLQQMVTQTRETRPPVEADIETATRHITDRQNPLPLIDLNEIFQQSNLQFDVRKVLISLAQVSAIILGVGPYANRLIAMLKQKLINKRNYQNDTAQCLVDMGFTRERAEYALRIHNNVYSTALEWLIARQSDDLTDKKIPTIPKSNSISSPSGIISNDNVLENTAALLEIVRIFSHRDIPPNADTVQSLVEMGFDEESVILALKKTCNNKASACEWLCGNRTGSLVELRDGLTEESPILKTMIELPHVQLALGNPKTFLAFLTILENENTLRVWSSNETSSVITQILQKYHEEKHVLGINQFYHSR